MFSSATHSLKVLSLCSGASSSVSGGGVAAWLVEHCSLKLGGSDAEFWWGVIEEGCPAWFLASHAAHTGWSGAEQCAAQGP